MFSCTFSKTQCWWFWVNWQSRLKGGCYAKFTLQGFKVSCYDDLSLKNPTDASSHPLSEKLFKELKASKQGQLILTTEGYE